MKRSLSDEQAQCLMSLKPGERLLILAGAGAGKTTVMTTRALKYGQTERIWMTTFTRNASQEIQKRLMETHLHHQIKVRTIDGLFMELVEWYQFSNPRFFKETLELEKIPSMWHITPAQYVLEDLKDDVLEVFKKHPPECWSLKWHEHIRKRNNLFEPSLIKQCGSFLLSEECLNDELLIEGEDSIVIQSFRTVAQKAWRRRLESGFITFLDLSIALYKLMQTGEITHPPHELIVDEYQDTNYLQHAIFERISAHQKWIVVGDPKQSLYRFRQARVDIINQLEKDPSWYKVTLTKNYRTGLNIIEKINEISVHLFTSKNPHHPSYIAYKPMVSDKKGGTVLWLERTSDEHTPTNQRNFEALLDHIESEKKQGIERQYAILCDRHSQLQTIASWLDKTSYTYEYLGRPRQEKLTPELLIIDSILNILQGQSDIKYWWILFQHHICPTPSQPFTSEAHYLQLLGLEETLSYLRKKFPFRPYETIRDFLRVLESLNKYDWKTWRALHDKLEPYWLVLYQTIGHEIENEALSVLLKIARRAMQDIEPLTQTHTQKQSLILSTIHGAKGLEWDAVVMWPLATPPKSPAPSFLQVRRTLKTVRIQLENPHPDDEEEEYYDWQRLYYTALTRAKDLLILMSPWQRNDVMHDFSTWIQKSPQMSLWSETIIRTGAHRLFQDVSGTRTQSSDSVPIQPQSERQPLSLQWQPLYQPLFPINQSCYLKSVDEQWTGTRQHEKLEINPFLLTELKPLLEQATWIKTEWEIWKDRSPHALSRFVLDGLLYFEHPIQLPYLSSSPYLWGPGKLIFEFKFAQPSSYHHQQVVQYIQIIKSQYPSEKVGGILLYITPHFSIIFENSRYFLEDQVYTLQKTVF